MYPQYGNQERSSGFPIDQIIVLITQLNGAVLGAAADPRKVTLSGEGTLLQDLQGRITRGDNLLGDRRYQSNFEITLQFPGGNVVVMPSDPK